jgi:hypothetical protein
MGSHVPSRQAERLLEGGLFRVGVEFGTDGAAHVQDRLVHALDDAGRVQTLRASELPVTGPKWEALVTAAEGVARAEATSRLKAAIRSAAERLDTELANRLDRLALDAERGDGDEKILRATEMVHEQQFADAIREALAATRLGLDSASFVLRDPSAGPRQR